MITPIAAVRADFAHLDKMAQDYANACVEYAQCDHDNEERAEAVQLMRAAHDRLMEAARAVADSF